MLARRLSLVGLAILVAGATVAGVAGSAKPGTDDKSFEYAVGLWGDLPYSAAQADPGIPNLIADMNSQDIQFSVHDGDLKAGNGPTSNPPSVTCSDDLYTTALGWFNSFEQPAIFTPGDNDWTDCDRPSNGGFNSLERLDHERQLFFSTPNSLGQKTLAMDVQGGGTCLGYVSGPAAGPTVTKATSCVENRRWAFHNVTYATFDVQGSCNNLCDTAPNHDEWAARNAADIAWLHETFKEAKDNGSAAVMLITQADPGFDQGFDSSGQGDPRAPQRAPKTLSETDGLPDGFQDWLLAVRSETQAFDGQVAYVHGDSHYFRVDKPLRDANGNRVENFTRVETFGDNAAMGTRDVNWLKVLVDPKSRDVFAFQPEVVPANQP
jgi:hypothetical protein